MKKTTKKPRLYRTVLAIAVAALVAVTLPFAALYVSAVQSHTAVASKSGSPVVTTKTSGGQTLVVSNGSASRQPAPAVSTRSS